MDIYALVDYDNARPLQREVAAVDVGENLERIAKSVTERAREAYPAGRLLCLRLYGGWKDIKANPTARALWVERYLPTLRRRINGISVVPELVVSNFECDFGAFVGLHRDGAQKMVDTLLVADLVILSTQFSLPVLLVSDDDDMIPGLVGSRSARDRICVMRRRSLGEGMNDQIFSALKMQVAGGVA